MSVESTFFCEGPECERHERTRQDTPRAFLTVATPLDEPFQHHFCGWDCVLKFAATKDPEEVYRPGEDGPASTEQEEAG